MPFRRYQGVEYIQGTEVPVFYIPDGKPPPRWDTLSLVTVSPSGLAFYQGTRTVGKQQVTTVRVIKITTTLRPRTAMLHEQGWRILLPLHRYYYQHVPELRRAFPRLEPLLQHWYHTLYTRSTMEVEEWETLLDDVKHWWQRCTEYWQEKEQQLKKRLRKVETLLARDFAFFDLGVLSSLPTLQQRFLEVSHRYRTAQETEQLQKADRVYGRLIRRLQEKSALTLQIKGVRRELSQIRRAQKQLALEVAEEG
ncbi:MAG: hypothetical protein D6736_14080 [Nitrospinota bacterium]|nr:MAG: hypothetical protein D6736_14080 [Nitrospinota bacterium]